jgi:predicted phosphoribosyltransferase
MIFEDRQDAGERLAGTLRVRLDPTWRSRTVVLGIPRGGVVVAAVVAAELGALLDVVIPRKIGAPGNPELGLGAVAEDVEVLDRRLIQILGVSEDYLREEIDRQREEIHRRTEVYRGTRPPVALAGAPAVVVDDGVATGGTAVAALRWARARGAERVVLAVPVAPVEALNRLRAEADDVVVLASPEPFSAVGQWYARFPQVPDHRVVTLLAGREAAG